MVIVRRSPAVERSKRRGCRGGLAEAGSATVVGIRAGRRTVEAAGTALGRLDLPLPLEQHGLAAHSSCSSPQGAGTGCWHRLSFLLPAGLADGLALKELRYAG